MSIHIRAKTYRTIRRQGHSNVTSPFALQHVAINIERERERTSQLATNNQPMSRRQGPGCVLPRCPFYLPRESISHTCVCYRNADISEHSAFHAMYALGQKSAGWWRDDQTRLFLTESRLTSVCMRGQGPGWVVLRASKQRAGRKNPGQ